MDKILVNLSPLLLLLIFMYFFFIKPQKKREKDTETMRKNVQVGDEIITIGGICGKIVRTKEDSVVIQVGADKVKFEIMRWSVSSVINRDALADAKKDSEKKEEEPVAPVTLPEEEAIVAEPEGDKTNPEA